MKRTTVEMIEDEMTRADRRVRALVRQRPFAALCTSVAAGFVLGRIFRRR
jgi:ElaB/YqjD/DUF883 family membrane-anchored ribosome-binding protein